MLELLRSRQAMLTLDEEIDVLRRARTSEPYTSVGELEAEYAEIVRVMDRLDRSRYAQLVDVRFAPPRNDTAYESTLARYHAALYRDFRANAVLVRSAVGKLQVKRMLDASGLKAAVFSDEREAIEHLAARRAGR